MSRRLLPVVAAVAALIIAATPVSAHPFPPRVDLPAGWAPEGITDGRATTAFVGSLADGAIARVDVRTGKVTGLAAGAAGRVTVGLDYEDARGRIWAAGGPTGEVRAYDAWTGALLATYQFGPGFLNDVVVTRRAVYVTNSDAQELEVVPLPRDGSLPDQADTFALPLTGDIAYAAGFNANGIVARRGWLIVVQTNTGMLFRVNRTTGSTTRIDLGGASVSFGDGLELHGSRLYVVRNQLNEVAVFRLGRHLRSARLLRTLTSPDLAVPTTAAFVAGRLWVVNARFDTPPMPDTEYWVTRLWR